MIDLFSGIGGFSLAASITWENLEILAFSEMDKYCQKILKKHWPHVPIVSNIKDVKGNEYGSVDIVTGGFPCQPYSHAGKRKGSADDRALWPEMLRVIREAKPAWVVAENVAGITSMAQPTMHSNLESEEYASTAENMVLEEICKDLEKEGFEVQPVIIPASAVGAPHRRDRIWIIAYSNSNRKSNATMYENEISGKLGYVTNSNNDRWRKRWTISYRKKKNSKVWSYIQFQSKRFGEKRSTSNTDSKRLWRGTNRPRKSKLNDENCERNVWRNFPTQSPICSRNDGVSDRVARLKALGNAIVPQVAYLIMDSIKKADGATP